MGSDVSTPNNDDIADMLIAATSGKFFSVNSKALSAAVFSRSYLATQWAHQVTTS